MKKHVCFSLFCVFLLGLFTLPSAGQTGDEVVTRMIRAMGGRKVLETVKDMTVTADVEVTQMGVDALVTTYSKEPNKSRVDIEVMGFVITQAFDGERAWMVDPQTGTAEDAPEEAQAYAKRDSLGYSSLLNPNEYGISSENKGKETVDEKECIVLVLSYADGTQVTQYLDAQTYLPYKTVSKALNDMLMEVEQEVFTSDYKDVNGLKIAHTVKILQDGTEYITSYVTDVKINTGLEDTLFKKGN